MPKYADADYLILYDQEFDHYVEVKIRYHVLGNYRLEKIPFRKFAFAYTMKNNYSRNTFYLTRWEDGKIGFIDLSKDPDRVDEMVARHDRGWEKDLYAFYDISRFQIITYWP